MGRDKSRCFGSGQRFRYFLVKEGATVSFDHKLALKIEKLIIGIVRRAKIIALVRNGIHKRQL
jgi:hypothetical protein